MKLNQLSHQTGVYTQTLRRRALQILGRTSGEFTDDECAMILESGEFTDDECAMILESLQASKQFEKTRHIGASEARQDLSLDKSRHKKYRYMKDEDVMMLDSLLFWKCPNYKIIPNRILVLKDLLQGLTNIGMKEAERMAKLEQQAAARFNAELEKYMSDDVNTKSLEYQWKLLQHPQQAVKHDSESDDF